MKVGNDIFDILNGLGFRIKMFNEEGKISTDAEESTRFYSESPNIMISIEPEDNIIKLARGSAHTVEEMEPIRKRIKELAGDSLMKFEYKIFNKNITPKDQAYQIKRETMENINEFRKLAGLPEMEENAGEYSYTLEYNGESNGYSIHKLTITNPEGESKVVGDDFTYFDQEGDELQAELESWFHKGMGVADASVDESIEEAMYSVTVNGGHEQRYRDFRGADVRIWKHIQGLEQKNNKEIPSKSPYGKVDPSKIILKRNGVEVPHKYTGKEKQPITGPLIGNSYPSDKLSEAMSDAYGIVSAEPEVEGSVEFKQHKNTDKGSVSIEASGEDMQELAKVLKLAGLTLPQDMYKDEPQASADDHEPEQEDVLLSPDHEGHDDIEKDHVEDGETCDCCGNEVVDGECGCGPECPHCGGKPGDLPKDDKVMVLSPKDASYSTDKEVLVNYLKDKLKKSIS